VHTPGPFQRGGLAGDGLRTPRVDQNSAIACLDNNPGACFSEQQILVRRIRRICRKNDFTVRFGNAGGWRREGRDLTIVELRALAAYFSLEAAAELEKEGHSTAKVIGLAATLEAARDGERSGFGRKDEQGCLVSAPKTNAQPAESAGGKNRQAVVTEKALEDLDGPISPVKFARYHSALRSAGLRKYFMPNARRLLPRPGNWHTLLRKGGW